MLRRWAAPGGSWAKSLLPALTVSQHPLTRENPTPLRSGPPDTIKNPVEFTTFLNAELKGYIGLTLGRSLQNMRSFLAFAE